MYRLFRGPRSRRDGCVCRAGARGCSRRERLRRRTSLRPGVGHCYRVRCGWNRHLFYAPWLLFLALTLLGRLELFDLKAGILLAMTGLLANAFLGFVMEVDGLFALEVFDHLGVDG